MNKSNNPKMKPISVRLTQEEWDLVDSVSDGMEMSISEYVRYLIGAKLWPQKFPSAENLIKRFS